MPTRLKNLRIIDPLLTNIVQGYSNSEYIAEKLFPLADAPMSGKILKWGKDMFLVHETERALRAKSNEIAPEERSTIDIQLREHDLVEPLDYIELDEADYAIEKRAAERVQEGLTLAREVESAKIATTLANYSADNQETLTDNFWNESAVNIIEEMHQRKDTLEQIIGKAPNTMVMGAAVWNKLKYHDALKLALSSVIGENSATLRMENNVPTTKALGALLEIPNIFVGRSKKLEGGSLVDVWGNYIIFAHIPKSASDPNSPSFGYTLRKKGYPYVDKWEENGGKLKMIRSTDMYAVEIVGPDSALIVKNPIDPDA
ncbi:MAG: hypothetical protein ACLFQX_08260 [Candidatus Kapaibacterium sp.]